MCCLKQVRSLFDEVLELHPEMTRLRPDAKLVQAPDFENAIVKVLDGEESTLTDQEKEKLSAFLVTESSATGYVVQQHRLNRTSIAVADRRFSSSGETGPVDAEPDIAKSLEAQMANKRRRLTQKSTYRDLKHIPPTSNTCERLFSGARMILTDYRKSMSPYTFECLMFLKVSRSFQYLTFTFS